MRFIKERILRFLEKRGYTLIRDQSKPLSRMLGLIKEWGFNPTLIFDVGFNHGAWTRTVSGFYPGAKIVVLEPQGNLKKYADELQGEGVNIEWLNAGAGASSGKCTFSIAKSDDSSSFALSTEESQKDVKQVTVDVVTLNDLARKCGRIPEFVKIDAEGWDLEVLEGAGELFGKTELFIVEAAVLAKGVKNTALALINKFDSVGYRLFDIIELNRGVENKVLFLTEMVFARKGGLLDAKSQSMDWRSF